MQLRSLGLSALLLVGCASTHGDSEVASSPASTAPAVPTYGCIADQECGGGSQCRDGLCVPLASAPAAAWKDVACWIAVERRVLEPLTLHNEPCSTLPELLPRCEAGDGLSCLGAARLVAADPSAEPNAARPLFERACALAVDVACSP